MKKLLFIMILAALGVAGGCVAAEDIADHDISNTIEQTADIQPVSYTPSDAALPDDPAAAFAFELFAESLANHEGNSVVSSVSAYFALAMAANGAEGATLAQFEEALGLPINELDALCRDLITRLSATEGDTIMNIADSVWADDDKITVYESFLQNCVDYFGAEVYTTDLPSTEALAAINDWVKIKTEGLIDKLHDDLYSEDTVLVLLNTIYFKATWAEQFDANATDARFFTLADGSEVSCDFLNAAESHRSYIHTDSAEGVLLPYNDGKTAFLALRPINGESIADFAMALTPAALTGYIDAAEDTLINLAMPKFDIAYELQMNDILKSLGLTEAFDPDAADFSRLGESAYGNIFISEVYQKARIKVDEAGTEAAAVTEVQMGLTAAPLEPAVELILDSPFFYAVVDLDSGLPLFMGIMDDPT
jgi:serine protease inhibitor